MPRRIIGAAFVSLDGVMQAPGGPEEDWTGGFDQGGWLAALFDEGIGNQVDSVFKPPFDLLLGRRTYEIFAAHWPFAPEGDEIGDLFRTIRKYVLTTRDAPLAWAGSERLADIDALAALRDGNGPNLVIQGSATLYPQLLERGLLDRIVTMTAPVVLGRGKRMFGGGTPPRSLELVEHRLTRNGIAMATYDVKGAVEIADFQFPEPTAEELARRARITAGEGW